MKRIISLIIASALLILSIPAYAIENTYSETVNNTVSGYVSNISGDIEIVSQSKTPSIYVDENDYAGVLHAVENLKDDIKTVTNVDVNGASDFQSADIIVGTIGKSAVIDELIANNEINVSKIENQWEAFTVQNVNGKLVIVGADKRGTIYGIYDFSEKMGVSPWNWWADVKPTHSDSIYVTLPNGGYTEGASSVKYRGIFINQEWNLYNWSKSLDKNGETGMNTATYEKIFDLLLRLKANYMWPAMHEYSPAFNSNPENAKKADEYGIVMGSSHCEMLLRNNMGELLDFQKKWIEENPDKNLYMFKDGSLNANVAYDYTDTDADGNHVYNKEFIEDYWCERVRANKDYESNFTIGMRGVHDGAWNPVNAKTDTEKVALLEEIIQKQREILSEEIGKPANEIPQTFIPYKEILPLYNAGLNVPDDVTIMWTNDNYGHIRQTANDAERERSGGGGIYYHVSYFGRPSSVIWNGGSQLGLIKEEMTKAYDSGANTVWMLNVGPLKPFENQTEYFLDLGRNIDSMRETSVKGYVKDNAQRYFDLDDETSEEYADIQCKFLETVNARRPEFYQQGIFSLTSYGDEGQKTVDTYADLLSRSEKIYNGLSDDKKAGFFELQLYAIKSANDVVNNYVGADKAVLYKKQGRGASVNKYAKQSVDGRNAIDTHTNEYNTLLDGKWNNIVNPFQKIEHGSWDIKIGGAVADTVSELGYTSLGVAAENQDDINTQPVLEFSGYTKDVCFIDIFNKGTGSINWKAESDKDFIVFNKSNGTVVDDDRIYVGIDWDKVENKKENAMITISEHIGDTQITSKEIEVNINNDIKELPEKTYAEANGYVSIEAEHYTNSVAKNDYKWEEQDDFGRSGTSMKLMPNISSTLNDNSVYLEYDVNFESTGKFDVDVYRMPTLNERGGVNCAIGIDDSTPTVLKGQNAYYNNSTGSDKWGKGILNNVEVLTATVEVAEKGIHKIRLYGVDTGTVIDKMVITTGTKYDSYYGAPESYNTTYNNTPQSMPSATTAATEITGEITELFSPKFYTVGLNYSQSGNGVSFDNGTKLTTEENDGIGIIAVYNSNGILKSMHTSDNYSNGAYVFDENILVLQTDNVKGMVWSSLTEMQPISQTYGTSEESGDIDGINIIKLADTNSAKITLAAYDKDGVMLASKTVIADFSTAKTNEKVTIPCEFNAPDKTSQIQVVVYDDENTLNALSPAYTVNVNSVSETASYENGVINVKSSLDKYTGREAICRISDNKTGETVYIRQETVADDTFKNINVGELNGTYDVNIGVSGNGIVANEIAYTAKNIETDNPETSTTLYDWDMSSDVTDSNGFSLSGNAAYDSENKAIKMTSTASAGGKISIDLSNAVKATQGKKTIITTNIAYGKLDKKYMNFGIIDSNGNELVYTHINVYSASATQNLKIGGVEQLNGGLQSGDGIKLSKTSNSGIDNGYSTFTVTLDADTNTITVNVKNKEGEATYTGKFPEGTSYDVAKLNYSTDYNLVGRSCYVGNTSIIQTSEPSYTIQFNAVDNSNNVLTNATVSVKDVKYNTVINPESDGTYHLCGGVYEYTVSADGYKTVTESLELTPATVSKIINVTLEKE